MNNKGFLFRLLLLAPGRELIISDLNPCRLLPQYWLLIRNDPDALVSAFPTIMIATWPKRPRVVVADHITLFVKHVIVAYWLTFAVLVVAFRVRVLTWVIFLYIFNFSTHHHPKYKSIGFYFQTDKKEEIFKNFEIINYLIFHFISVVFFLIGLMDSCCN